MATMSRARRAELQRRAQEIRLTCQRDGIAVEQIALAILDALQPEMRRLEAWRIAYGWSRPQCVADRGRGGRRHQRKRGPDATSDIDGRGGSVSAAAPAGQAG
ncbi:hypothetical protein Sru01_37510 [Sphaerisporangium rufum]|uniref:Uncharacterized protein n=1 Tax=Sphaerisporangium rufum TaxID=1381558 RepID=A0A919R385_9ACTN|nr:hypothetical protein Sru01_37510 [Sphaerisporangium rufum]